MTKSAVISYVMRGIRGEQVVFSGSSKQKNVMVGGDVVAVRVRLGGGPNSRHWDTSVERISRAVMCNQYAVELY